MKNKKYLIAGVVFSGVKKYLPDYIYSIQNQTDKQFDWLIINDNADESLKSLFPAHTIWINAPKNITIAENRQIIFDFAVKNNCNSIIFTDTDDYFSLNRIEKNKYFLEHSDFVYNELTLVDENKNILSKNYLQQLNVASEINDVEHLLEKNVCGLSSSAINLSGISSIRIPKDIIAVDWWLFSILLLQKQKGKFIPEVLTFYRQHGINTVGISSEINEQKLKSGIKTKKNHYYHLKEFCLENNIKEYQYIYNKLYLEICELENKISDTQYLSKYISTINKNYNNIYKGWWSEILTINQIKKYE